MVTGRAVVETDVLIRAGRIRLGGAGSRKGMARVDGRGLVLLPGFVDLHAHGYGGFDFTLGQYDAAADRFDGSAAALRAGLASYVARMPALGVTTGYLATTAASAEALRRRLGILAEFISSPAAGMRLPGAFLEGTFISKKMTGAMNPKLVLRPDAALFDRINAAGVVRLALVAPDGGGAALELVRHLVRRGVVVGAGHTAATAEELRAARRVGLSYMVHFLNGPTGSSFKPFDGGGAVEGALGDDGLFVELIADGYHVDPRYVRDLVARKICDRVVAVTDAMFAAGVRGLKKFRMNGMGGRVSADGKYMHVADRPEVLFGSRLDMPTAVGNLLSWLTRAVEGIWVRRHEAVGLEAALVAVARMTSGNAARLTGLDRELGIGEIANGRTADLALVRLSGRAGAYRVAVRRTWVGGREVFRLSKSHANRPG